MHIAHSAINLDLDPRESSRGWTIANGSILTIWTRLPSFNPGTLARSKFQVSGRVWYIFFFITLLSFTALGAQETLTMDECVRRAKENSPVSTVAQSKVNEAKASKREIVSQMMPQIIGKGVWDNRNGTLDGELSQFQDFHSTLAGGVSVNIGLCDFGSSWSHLKASSLFVRASKWQQEQMLQNLEETVRNAYLRVLEAERAVEASERSMKTLSKQQEISKDFFDQGLVTQRDTLSVELQLAQKKREFLSAKNALSRKDGT